MKMTKQRIFVIQVAIILLIITFPITVFVAKVIYSGVEHSGNKKIAENARKRETLRSYKNACSGYSSAIEDTAIEEINIIDGMHACFGDICIDVETCGIFHADKKRSLGEIRSKT